MITFKQFTTSYVNEVLKVDKGVVTFSTQSSAFRADDRVPGEIDTFIGPNPHNEDSPRSGNIKIRSTFLYRSHDTVTGMLKSLKGDGPYDVNPASYEKLLETAAKSAAKVIRDYDIDTVIYPKSSSKFLTDFVNALKDKIAKSIVILPDAIVKKQIDKVKLDKGDVSDLINFEHPSFNTLKDSTVKSLRSTLLKTLKDNDAAGKGATISAKEIDKRHVKFVLNFLEMVEEVSGTLQDKNVLIIDDVLSSGATFAEMVRLVKKEDVKSVTGYTIFKNTGTPPKKS